MGINADVYYNREAYKKASAMLQFCMLTQSPYFNTIYTMGL